MRGNVVIAFICAGLIACATSTSNVAGHYYWGAEVESFQPCGSENSYWVVGDTTVLQPLRDKAADLIRRKEPYSAVFVMANAPLEPKATDGFAAEYDGVYRFNEVTHVNEVSPSGCLPHR